MHKASGSVPGTQICPIPLVWVAPEVSPETRCKELGNETRAGRQPIKGCYETSSHPGQLELDPVRYDRELSCQSAEGAAVVLLQLSVVGGELVGADSVKALWPSVC